jgi:hypothetical protein
MWSAERKSSWFTNIFDVALRFEKTASETRPRETAASLAG